MIRKDGQATGEQGLLAVLANEEGNYQANYQLGMLYHREGRNHLAIPRLQAATRSRPEDFSALANLGIIQHIELLFNINLPHPIQIGAFRCLKIDLFDRPCGIIYPKISFESKFILSSWIIDNIVTPFIANESTV